MNHETIKNTIERHYEHHDSKFVLGGRRQNMDYYYDTAGWDRYKEIFLREGAEMLSYGPGTVMINFHKEKEIPKTEYELFIKLRKDDEGNSILEFYGINGLWIRRFNEKPAFQVVITKLPLFNIMICNQTCELYWKNREGDKYPLRFTWWLNRLLQENDGFRIVFADLLMELGNEKKILKDISRTISADHYFLPEITVSDMLRYHNPDQLIRSCTEEELPVNFNKWDINAAWYAARLAENIEKRDHGRLFSIPQEKLLSWIMPEDIFSCPDISRFAAEYYIDKFECIYPSVRHDVKIFSRDYARMITENNERMSLRKDSIKALERLHDDVARQMMRREAAGMNAGTYQMPGKPITRLQQLVHEEHSQFAPLRRLLPDEFEWITTEERLYQEGNHQHNCVYSYMNRIINDDIAIYHWEHQNRKYTIEFGLRRGRYVVLQMMQTLNRRAERCDEEIVQKYLSKEE